MRVLAQYIFPALLAFVGLPRLALASEVADAAANIGQALPLASVLPFVLCSAHRRVASGGAALVGAQPQQAIVALLCRCRWRSIS